MNIVPDARIVILAHALRTFGYGFTSVLLGVLLTNAGASTLQVGILLMVAALGSITCSLVMGMYADRVGRKRLLMISALLMVGTGYIFALTQYYPLLLLATFCGTISPSTNDNTPFSGIEQAILAQSAATEQHTRLFSIYNLVAQLAGAVGGLVVGLPQLLTQFGMSTDAGVHVLFLVYALVAGSTVLLFLCLSPSAELQKVLAEDRPSDPVLNEVSVAQEQIAVPRPKVRSIILKLSSLFAVDAFAGGLAAQTVLTLWLLKRFNVPLGQLGLLFFGMNLMAALSFLPAMNLSKRLGLLKTMVIPHSISNVCMLLVPFMPAFPLAAGLLLLRQSLSKIDVPARQAYTAALVAPEERTAAASFTTIARSVAISLSPLVSGLMLSSFFVMSGLPFILSGCIDLGYDITLWRIFRYVPLYRPVADEKKLATQFKPLHFPHRSLPVNFPLSLDDHLWGVLVDMPLYTSDQPGQQGTSQFKRLHFPRSS
jgi:MFS family permease